jgi:hypothetical protein
MTIRRLADFSAPGFGQGLQHRETEPFAAMADQNEMPGCSLKGCSAATDVARAQH